MQKTAYEVGISYWSSDVCSSDLGRGGKRPSRSRSLPANENRNSAIRKSSSLISASLSFRSTGRSASRCGPRTSSTPSGCRPEDPKEIGRAARRERVCQYVKSSEVAESCKKKQSRNTLTNK